MNSIMRGPNDRSNVGTPLQPGGELSTLLEISQVISETLDMQVVLQAVIDGAAKLADLHSGALYLLNDRELYLGATTPPLPPNFPEEFRRANLNDHPHIQRTFDDLAPTVIPDIENERLSAAERAICTARGLRSLLYLPLLIKRRPIGVLILGTVDQPRSYADPEIILYHTLANQAALALENARLFHQVKSQVAELEYRVEERTEELTELNRYLREEIVRHEQTTEELIRTQAAAEQANRVKSDFLAKMSHEIRTPLNGVIGLSHLLRNSLLTAEQSQWIEGILFSGETLLSVISDILDFSKIEAGRIEIDNIDFNLKDMLQQIYNLTAVHPSITKKQLLLQLHIAPDVPTSIHGDSVHLRQILFNLLSNAAKFTEQGTIRLEVKLIRAQQNAHRIEFAVKDSGIGITPEQLTKLFQPFSQADVSTTRKYGGTGLGLVISQRLVEMLGGTIEVESAPEKGSTFRFSIPLNPAQTVADTKQSSNTQPGTLEPGLNQSSYAKATAKIKQVLVAEDNDVNLMILRKMLEQKGWIVDAARNGEEAVSAFKSHRYAMVFMDVEMPILNGIDAVMQIREYETDAKLPLTPVIACTAHAFNDLMQEYLVAGMTGVITKPISPDALQAEIDRNLI